MFIVKATDLGVMRRYVAPIAGLCGSVFMVFAAVYAHGTNPYVVAKQEGYFSFPIVFYLVVFLIIQLIGAYFLKKK
jgi:uncharacterized membrane protein